jgi:hypothetical protein
MNLPDQKAGDTRQLVEFKPPWSKPIFDNTMFVPTGEGATWYQGERGRTDTCAWRVKPREDFLTARIVKGVPWIERHIVSRLRNILHSTDPNISTHMRHDRLVGFVDVFSCLLAPVFMTTTVVVLAVVRPLKYRIIIVWVFGSLFVLSLKLAGSPTRGEVFGATAAFFAVAVVFLGSMSNKCDCTIV